MTFSSMIISRVTKYFLIQVHHYNNPLSTYPRHTTWVCSHTSTIVGFLYFFLFPLFLSPFVHFQMVTLHLFEKGLVDQTDPMLLVIQVFHLIFLELILIIFFWLDAFFLQTGDKQKKITIDLYIIKKR